MCPQRASANKRANSASMKLRPPYTGVCLRTPSVTSFAWHPWFLIRKCNNLSDPVCVPSAQGRILLVGARGQHWGWIIINYSLEQWITQKINELGWSIRHLFWWGPYWWKARGHGPALDPLNPALHLPLPAILESLRLYRRRWVDWCRLQCQQNETDSVFIRFIKTLV